MLMLKGKLTRGLIVLRSVSMPRRHRPPLARQNLVGSKLTRHSYMRIFESVSRSDLWSGQASQKMGYRRHTTSFRGSLQTISRKLAGVDILAGPEGRTITRVGLPYREKASAIFAEPVFPFGLGIRSGRPKQ